MILALICMTGLAIFLISDLVSFASNSDHRGVLVGLDLKDSENGIVPMKDGKEKSGNIGANSSLALENLSSQTKEQASSNLSQIKSSSSSYSVKEHHSSSSSSSSAKSAKKSNDKNNLTNQSINNSQGAAKSQITNSSSLSDEGQSSVLFDQERVNSQGSNDSKVEPTAIPASLPSVAIAGITNPVSIIQFKSEQSLNSDSQVNILDTRAPPDSGVQESSPVVDNNNAQSSSQKSKVTASSRAQKVQEARAKQIANRNQVADNMKKKTAQSRAKAARN
jgi:hypothetical protein